MSAGHSSAPGTVSPLLLAWLGSAVLPPHAQLPHPPRPPRTAWARLCGRFPARGRFPTTLAPHCCHPCLDGWQHRRASAQPAVGAITSSSASMASWRVACSRPRAAAAGMCAPVVRHALYLFLGWRDSTARSAGGGGHWGERTGGRVGRRVGKARQGKGGDALLPPRSHTSPDQLQ